MTKYTNEDANVIDFLALRNKVPEIGHEQFAAWATENLLDKVYFDAGQRAIDQLDDYLELHLYLLSFEFDLNNKAFVGDREHQSRGAKFSGVTTAFDLAMVHMTTDIEECIKGDILPKGLEKDYLMGADLMPYSISFVTDAHRTVDLRAPVNSANFDTLLLVTPGLFAFFDRYVRKFGVTTFGNLLSYSDGSIVVTMKVTPYHRSFGSLSELIERKVSGMAIEDLKPLLPGAHPILELPFRMEFDTDFYRWQEGREADFAGDAGCNDGGDDPDDTAVSIHC